MISTRPHFVKRLKFRDAVEPPSYPHTQDDVRRQANSYLYDEELDKMRAEYFRLLEATRLIHEWDGEKISPLMHEQAQAKLNDLQFQMEKHSRQYYPLLFGSLIIELHSAGFEMREAQSNLEPDPVQDTSAPDLVRKPLRAQVKCRAEDLLTVERYFVKYGYRVETMWKQAGADEFEFHYFRNHTN